MIEKTPMPGGNPALDSLAGLTVKTDNQNGLIENPAAAEQPGAPAPADYATEAAALTDMVAALINGYAPKTAHLWQDDTKLRITAALAPVMEKYNFTLGNIPPELTLLIVVGPVMYQSAKIIAADMPTSAAKPAAAAPAAPAEAPGKPDPAAVTTHDQAMMSLTV